MSFSWSVPTPILMRGTLNAQDAMGALSRVAFRAAVSKAPLPCFHSQIMWKNTQWAYKAWYFLVSSLQELTRRVWEQEVQQDGFQPELSFPFPFPVLATRVSLQGICCLLGPLYTALASISARCLCPIWLLCARCRTFKSIPMGIFCPWYLVVF